MMKVILQEVGRQQTIYSAPDELRDFHVNAHLDAQSGNSFFQNLFYD